MILQGSVCTHYKKMHMCTMQGYHCRDMHAHKIREQGTRQGVCVPWALQQPSWQRAQPAKNANSSIVITYEACAESFATRLLRVPPGPATYLIHAQSRTQYGNHICNSNNTSATKKSNHANQHNTTQHTDAVVIAHSTRSHIPWQAWRQAWTSS
jgi:hypothetical protein